MKTAVITGGASGIGNGIALQLLEKGFKVIVISFSNESKFVGTIKNNTPKNNIQYIQANLSLVSENYRVIEEIRSLTSSVDVLIFCATMHNLEFIKTVDNLESSFALDYLSRFILSYGLKELLENSKNPIILNLCGTGMKGVVNWADLQHENSFNPQRVMMHGSRLNDLSGVAFAKRDSVRKIKYILYNPWAVKTQGMKKFYKNPVMWQLYKIIGKSIEAAAKIIVNLLDNPPQKNLSAFRENKEIDLNKDTYNENNADKLYLETVTLLGKLENKKNISEEVLG